ncbi:MAG: uroporphyrinogen decarboxylase family protein [Anaerolineae bacterium]
MLTSRDRVLCALNHEEPDRVPIFFGTSGATTMLAPGYERLKAFLGIGRATTVFWRGLQYVLMDEEALAWSGSDGRPLLLGPPPTLLARDISPDAYVDGWGCLWERRPGAVYYEVMDCPIFTATVDDLDRFPWPDLAHPSRFAGLRGRAGEIRDAGYAVVALSGVSPWEQAYLMRGIERALYDLAADPEFILALLRKITDLMKASVIKMLDVAGDCIDVLITGDDLGMQRGPMMSPAMYRRMIKPLHAEIYHEIKKRTQAKIFYHSDGNIYPLLGDLIELGIDLLNPVQVNAGTMGDTARLKREFGDRLSFCGAIDTGWVLPHGTTEDVRAEVRRRIKDLGPEGGYILASVHCIQPDVPLENIIAMLDEARIAGQYPLAI